MKLKGKLTKISAALWAVLQSPEALAEFSKTAETFAANAEAPISYLSLVAAAGVIWGGLRASFDYFGK